MKKLSFLLILFVFLVAFAACSETENLTIDLSPLEQKWLDKHPVIYYAPDPEFAPYEYIEDGVHAGIVADYLRVIEDHLNIKVVSVNTKSWTEALELGRNNEVDFMFMTKTAEREHDFYFTNSFISAPNVLLSNSLSDKYITTENIENYQIGLLKDYSSTEYFKLVYPQGNTSEYDTIIDGLLELSYGTIDGFLVDFGQASYYMNKLNIKHLKISDEINFEYKFSFAVPKENKDLIPILEKVIASISEKEHIQIRDSWIDLQYKDWLNRDQIKIIYFLLIGLLIIAIAISIWTFMLRRMVNQKTNELEMLNQDLENRVNLRTQELSNSNHELESSIDKLVETQEQLLQSKKYEALSKLVSGVAHKINTPLGNMITSITYNQKILSDINYLINNDKLTTIQLKNLIKELSNSNLITNTNLKNVELIISKFKKLEIVDVSNSKKKIDFGEVIRKTIDSMTFQNSIPTNVQFDFNFADDLILNSYIPWIEEITSCLVTNSIEHNHGKNITIIIRAKKLENQSIKLIFEDNGVGINEADQSLVFEPFYTSKNNSSNIGLGLSITRSIIVNNMYGTIILKSKLDKFTRFTINIPSI